MAVDTRQKRFSMMALRQRGATRFKPLFEADGSVDADDRLHLLGLYSGLAATGAPVTVGKFAGFTQNVGRLLIRT